MFANFVSDRAPDDYEYKPTPNPGGPVKRITLKYSERCHDNAFTPETALHNDGVLYVK